MLKFILKKIYGDFTYTKELDVFYDIYQWTLGLYTLLSLRYVVLKILLCLVGFYWFIFIEPWIFSICFLGTALIIFLYELIDIIKISKDSEARTLKAKSTEWLTCFIGRIKTFRGKALGKQEWKAIKKRNKKLYKDLLSPKAHGCCYYYSLEIAKIFMDSTLIWCGVEEPLQEEHKYYAHAIILKNGYVYDSNLRQSVKYEDYVKLYNLKPYKQWKYEEYSKPYFRERERKDFGAWCRENNVLVYEKF